jgi:hypothetical protein
LFTGNYKKGEKHVLLIKESYYLGYNNDFHFHIILDEENDISCLKVSHSGTFLGIEFTRKLSNYNTDKLFNFIVEKNLFLNTINYLKITELFKK